MSDAKGGRVSRVRGWGEERAQRAQRRLEVERARHTMLDGAVTVALRPNLATDTLVAGYMALRIFVLLFPLAYLVIGGIGLFVQSGNDAADATKAASITGALATSVAQAAKSSDKGHILAIAAGLAASIWAARGALHAVRIAHTVAWRLPFPRKTIALGPPLLFAVLTVLTVFVGNLATRLRRDHDINGILVFVLLGLVIGGMWLIVSEHLPHRPCRRSELLPGAVFVGLAAAAFNIAMVVYFGPKLSRASGTYGAVGIGVVALTYLGLVSWMILLSAELNASLYEWRHRDDPLVEASTATPLFAPGTTPAEPAGPAPQ